MENRAPASVSNEQFHRETTDQVVSTTEPTVNSGFDFDQWEAAQRQPVSRPVSPSRQANPVRTPVEEVVAQPPRSQSSNNRFNQPQADVDYRDSLVDDFVTSEPDQFADYDIFDDSNF